VTVRLSDYRQLDSRLFKAFMAAAETENFTAAAKKAHMTQSGVSQHVAKLEAQVGLQLFKRLGKRVVLTETGEKLAAFIKGYAGTVGELLDELRAGHEHVAGEVSYAMPVSCLMSPHFPMLLEKRLEYPELTLDVNLAPSEEVIRKVLDDKIDFGFSTVYYDHPDLDFELFCREEYILVGRDRAVVESIDETSVGEQLYVTYPGADVYYDAWFGHYFPKVKGLEYYALNIAGSINSIEGAVKMVTGGLGIGVFPRHCVDSELSHGALHEYPTSGEPLLNNIYFVRIKEHRYPRAVRQVLDWFREMHCED
jgi:DNA-binding transcriptional LysR family regulator